jgi:membrane protease YdiL (CAAX protease family)
MTIPPPFDTFKSLEKESLEVTSLGILGVLSAVLIEGLCTTIIVAVTNYPYNSSSYKDAIIKFSIELLITLLIIFFLSKIFCLNSFIKYNYSKFSFKDLIFCALIILGLRLFYTGTIQHITASMTMPKYIEDAFKEASINPVYFLLSVGILAPLKEEFLYRGIIFNGLCKKYPYGFAIIISSLIFGAAHFNFPQGINGFFMGVIIAYIYYHTRSIYLCIFMHMFNNIFVSLVSLNTPSNFILLKSIAFTVLGLLFLFWGFKNLNLKEKYSRLREQNLY